MILVEACRDRVLNIRYDRVETPTADVRWERGLEHLLQSSSCCRRFNEARSAGDEVAVELCCDLAQENGDERDKAPIHDNPRPGKGQNLPLMYVCRQIHAEASVAANIAYTSHTFTFPTLMALVNFVNQVANKDVAAIRKVHVRLTYNAYTCFKEDLWFVKGIVCSFFDGLEELHVGAHHRDLPVGEERCARLVRGKKEAKCMIHSYALRLLRLIRVP